MRRLTIFLYLDTGEHYIGNMYPSYPWFAVYRQHYVPIPNNSL
jgi:hypothetical protein